MQAQVLGRGKCQNTFLFNAPQSIVWRSPNLAHLSTWLWKYSGQGEYLILIAQLGEQPVQVTLHPQQTQYLKTLFLRYIKHTYPLQKSSVNAVGSEIHTHYRITFCGQKLLLLNVKTGDI